MKTLEVIAPMVAILVTLGLLGWMSFSFVNLLALKPPFNLAARGGLIVIFALVVFSLFWPVLAKL